MNITIPRRKDVMSRIEKDETSIIVQACAKISKAITETKSFPVEFFQEELGIPTSLIAAKVRSFIEDAGWSVSWSGQGKDATWTIK